MYYLRMAAHVANPKNLVITTKVWADYKMHGYNVPFMRIATF